MDKWEYLICAPAFITMIHTNLSVDQFSIAFSSEKVTSPKKGLISIEWKGKSDEVGAFQNTVLDYLGSQGWEAYHVNGNVYHFKRKISV